MSSNLSLRGHEYQGNSADGSARQHNGDVIHNAEVITNITSSQGRKNFFNNRSPEARREILLTTAAQGQRYRLGKLIDAGADLDYKDDTGQTALHKAAFYGHLGCVRLLVKSGADINAKDSFGGMPVYQAVDQCHYPVVAFLVDEKANLNARYDSVSALHIAVNARRDGELIVKKLLQGGAVIEAKDNLGRTALISAASRGYDSIVRILLDRGAAIEAKDNMGHTALVCAAWQGSELTVRVLLDRGAAIEAKDNQGKTALIYVKEYGHKTLVRMLEEAQAT